MLNQVDAGDHLSSICLFMFCLFRSKALKFVTVWFFSSGADFVITEQNKADYAAVTSFFFPDFYLHLITFMLKVLGFMKAGECPETSGW